MYSTEIAFIFVLIAIAVALVVWYQFHPKVVVDTSYDDLETIYPPQSFTCFNCCDVDKCEYAFDLYNLDGDCLADK